MFNQNLNLPTIKVLSTPILVILVTVILFVVSVNTLVAKITTQLAKIEDTQTKIGILENKIEVLKVFDSKVTEDKTDITYLVLPDSNPVAVSILQTKNTLAEAGGEEISDLEFRGSEGLDSIQSSQVGIKFGIPDLRSLAAFLNSFHRLAPIVTIDEVKIGATTASPVEVEMSFSTYWSKLPEQLPELDQAVNDLTPEEGGVLNNILTYTLPTFSVDSEAVLSTDRVNPFN